MTGKKANRSFIRAKVEKPNRCKFCSKVIRSTNKSMTCCSCKNGGRGK